MAKNFGKTNAAKKIQAVAQTSNAVANVIDAKIVDDVDLLDCPFNEETVTEDTYTADIEASIEEVGFTDPIEVTRYSVEEAGKYMIISGHRRRMAGRKKGISTFPVLVKSFESEQQVRNYVLMANNYRDSAKDPLLLCRRYRNNLEYLQGIGFKGDMRVEIARRLGLSIQQADRYASFNRVIEPVWQWVKDEVVGMSSVIPMATHTGEEQEEILALLQSALDDGRRLTRDTTGMIINAYRSGARTLEEVFITPHLQVAEAPAAQKDLPLQGAYITPEDKPREEETPANPLRPGEVRREGDRYQEDDKPKYEDERPTDEDFALLEDEARRAEQAKREKAPPLTPEEKAIAQGEVVSKALSKLETAVGEVYKFEHQERAQAVIQTMNSMISIMLNECKTMAEENDLMDTFKEVLRDVGQEAQNYAEKLC